MTPHPPLARFPFSHRRRLFICSTFSCIGFVPSSLMVLHDKVLSHFSIFSGVRFTASIQSTYTYSTLHIPPPYLSPVSHLFYKCIGLCPHPYYSTKTAENQSAVSVLLQFLRQGQQRNLSGVFVCGGSRSHRTGKWSISLMRDPFCSFLITC